MPDVYVSQIDFGDGILRSFKGEGGGGITDFVDVPIVEETEFTYDGTQKELVFDDLDTDKITVSGATATQAGTHICTLTLKSEGYFWKDLTNEPKQIEWVITKINVYGVEWDGTATTSWTRTDDAAEFEDPNPYVSGASSYGSPFDNLMPWAGMVKERRTGGIMVKIPKFWYKLTQNGNGLKIQIADDAIEGFSVSPAHMDRGDGNGERDVVYIGRYHSSGYLSGPNVSPSRNISRETARTGIHNLGTDIWQSDFAMRFTIWLLYLVEFADWNSQAKIGFGCGWNSSGLMNNGYTDSMPYHTGTTFDDRTTYGYGGTQYRNIEGLWDNVFDWMDGCYYNSSGMSVILNPSSFNDDGLNGYFVGTPVTGMPSSFTVNSYPFPLFIPSSGNGSDSTYSCDSWEYYNRHPCLYVGGNYNQSSYYGLFYVSRTGKGSTSEIIGCRLMELPSNS